MTEKPVLAFDPPDAAHFNKTMTLRTPRAKEFLVQLAQLLDEYDASLGNPTDDNGIHIEVQGAEVFVGHLSGGGALRAAAGLPAQAPTVNALGHLRMVEHHYRNMHRWRLLHECEDPDPTAEKKETVHRIALALDMAKVSEYLASVCAPAVADTDNENG